jgi:Mg-chelatase subunit ChlD
MSLIAPAWLLLCGFGLLVLVLHLRRPRTLEVPSIKLWRLLEGGAAARRAIRPPPPNVLMLLQLAAVALIALALARPLIGAGPRFAHEIVVVDASGSMRSTDVAPSRFGAAVAQLSTMAGSLTETGARLTVIFGGPVPRIVAARLASPDGLGEQLGRLRAGDGETDWTKVARFARGVIRDGEPTRLVLMSDRPDRAVTRLSDAVSGVTIETRFVGSASLRNAGLSATIRAVQPNGQKWRTEGTVTFSPGFPGATSVTALVTPEGSDGFLEWGSVDVRPPSGNGEAAGRTTQAAFSLDLDLRIPSAVMLRLADDDGPQDNTVQFVVRPKPHTLRILMLGAASEPLVRAFRAAADVELVAAEKLPADVSAFDLVVANGVEIAARPATNVLWLGSAHHATGEPPEAMGEAVPEIWRDDHPLLRSVDWNAVKPRTGYRFSRLPGATALVEAGAVPLIEARSTPAGREVRIAFDLDGSNWTALPGFPIFISNLLHWIAPDLGRTVDSPCAVGANCTPDPRLAGGQISLVSLRPSDSRAAPDGEPAVPRVAALLGGAGNVPRSDDAAFVPDRAGLYRFTRNGLTGYVAVNAPPAEADAQPPAAAISSVALPGLFGCLPAWWWLLASAFAVLAVEAWIAGRGPERFLHSASLASGNPLARRRRMLLSLRAAALLFLAMSLAGVPLLTPDRHQNVVVVAGPDLAAPPGELLARVDGAAARHPSAGATRLAVVSVGAGARVVRDLDGDAGLAAEAASVPTPSAADLETALATAAAMLPEGEPGRVVVAFDGNETRGDASLALSSVVERRLRIDVLPMTHLRPGEVLVEEVSAPQRSYAGESFPLQVLIYAQGHSTGRLRVLKDGEVIAERPLEIPSGRSRVETVIPAAAAGRARYEVAIDATADTFAQNNRNGIAVEIAPPPKVLIIAAQPAWGEVFARALSVHRIDSKVVEAKRAPYYLKDWLAYAAVVLMNVPAIDLTTGQQELIEKAVAEHGRGLLLLGGENSFGPGGYYETPLERVSPLSSRVPREMPRVALVFVLDRSGSMQRDEGGATRLDIAKQATLGAIRLLHPESQIAIVVFDSEAKVLLPLGQAGNSDAVARALQQLEPGGGTAIYPGLVEALRQFAGVDAAAKHIVVMSDGLTQPGDFPGIIKAISDQGISVSAVAIGDGADPVQLREIARLGKGSFHATQDFKALPSILSQEALLLSGKPVEEREAAPLWIERSAEFFAGLPVRMPPLGGYVLTTRKPQADLHIAVLDEKQEQVPLFASWRYGNGRIVALATHGAGAWTKDWQQMPEYPLLWSQTLRHVIPATGEGLLPHVTRRGDVADVDVEALNQEGAPRAGLAVTVSFSDAAGVALPIAPLPLAEVSPGRYHGRVTLDQTGEMTLRFTAGETAAETPFFVSYPALYRFTAADPERLAALARATGGRILSGEDGIFAEENWRWTRQAGWPLWAALAFILFMVDLIIRYAPGLIRFGRSGRTAT